MTDISLRPNPSYILCIGVDDKPCGQWVSPMAWTAHARTHNPAAYSPDWPCRCRSDAPCEKHRGTRA